MRILMVALQQVHDDAPIVVGVGELFRSTAPPKQLLILQPATTNQRTGNPQHSQENVRISRPKTNTEKTNKNKASM